MDLDIAKNLSQLQARKLAIETGTDLTQQCNTLMELDNRVGSLLDQVKRLRADLEQRFGFMDATWDQLGPPYHTLLLADQVLDLVIGVNKLNKICRRLETNPNLVRSEDGQRLGVICLPRLAGETTEDSEKTLELEGDDKSTLLIVGDLLDSFEDAYKPMEELMSSRCDLPYAAYATKVRALRDSLSKLKVLKLE